MVKATIVDPEFGRDKDDGSREDTAGASPIESLEPEQQHPEPSENNLHNDIQSDVLETQETMKGSLVHGGTTR